jgi:hypothetical protein
LDLAALLAFIDNQTKSLIDVCVSGFLGRDVWRQRSVELFEQQAGVGVGDRVPRIDSATVEFWARVLALAPGHMALWRGQISPFHPAHVTPQHLRLQSPLYLNKTLAERQGFAVP